MRVDLRRFKASRVSVGGLGTSGIVEEPEEVVVEVESGEALGGGEEGGKEGGFPPYITSLMSPLDTIGPCSWNEMM